MRDTDMSIITELKAIRHRLDALEVSCRQAHILAEPRPEVVREPSVCGHDPCPYGCGQGRVLLSPVVTNEAHPDWSAGAPDDAA